MPARSISGVAEGAVAAAMTGLVAAVTAEISGCVSLSQSAAARLAEFSLA